MSAPTTALRQSHRRARALGFEGQLRECIDQLQHPELITAEIAAAHAEVAGWLATTRPTPESTAASAAPVDRTAHFYPSREVFVVRDSSSFTCLATAWSPPVLVPDAGTDAIEGLDYVAVTCTASPRPVLGVVQNQAEGSAYPLLLRLFACLCEIAHESQLVQLDRQVLKGLAGSMPLFDLHLVLWDAWAGDDSVPERTPISQLTRDLAETAKASLAANRLFPPLLRDIVCLHMNPNRFDGRVRFGWRV